MEKELTMMPLNIGRIRKNSALSYFEYTLGFYILKNSTYKFTQRGEIREYKISRDIIKIKQNKMGCTDSVSDDYDVPY